MKNAKLRKARERCNLTQAKVAQMAGITEVCYQNYEAGERIPRADVALRIAKALKVKSLDQFTALFAGATADSESNDTPTE